MSEYAVCTNCQRPLLSSMEEFGPIHAPICWDCFINPKTNPDVKISVEKELEELKDELNEVEDQISSLEDDRYDLERRIEKLKKTGKSTQKVHLGMALINWSRGIPIKGGDARNTTSILLGDGQG